MKYGRFHAVPARDMALHFAAVCVYCDSWTIKAQTPAISASGGQRKINIILNRFEELKPRVSKKQLSRLLEAIVSAEDSQDSPTKNPLLNYFQVGSPHLKFAASFVSPLPL